MQIKLINCNARLLALGINMQAIGSGELLADKLPTNYESWEYDYIADMLLVTLPDGSEVPDMSQLGELVPDAVG